MKCVQKSPVITLNIIAMTSFYFIRNRIILKQTADFIRHTINTNRHI